MDNSRFTDKTYIGSGGMASVYKAYDTRLERDVAIKEIAEQLRDNKDIRNLFLSEARKMAQILDSNVVQVYDVIDDADVPTILMEFLAGGSLASQLGIGTIQSEEVLDIMEQVVSGLKAIHDAGVIHRDLKPENILQDKGVYKITDFGVAMTGEEDILPFITNRYAAPEVLLDPASIGPNSDLYSIGIMAIELMLGSQRFEEEVKEAIAGDQELQLAKSGGQAFWQQWIASPTEIRSLDSIDHSISPDMAHFLAHLTKRDQVARPADCSEVLVEIRKIRQLEARRVSAETIPEPKMKRAREKILAEQLQATTGETATRKKKRPLWFTLTVGVASLLILAIATLFLLPSGTPKFHLDVVSNPPGASVTINGKTVENQLTPTQVTSGWGDQITITMDGMLSRELVVDKTMPGLSATENGRQLDITLERAISITRSAEAAALLKKLATNSAQLEASLDGLELLAKHYTVEVGTPLHFRIQAEMPGALTILHLGSDDAATLIYPSPTGKVRSLEEKSLLIGPELNLVATEPLGREWMVIVISDRPLQPPNIQGLQRVGDWGRRYPFSDGDSPGSDLILWLVAAFEDSSVSAVIVETEVVFRVASR